MTIENFSIESEQALLGALFIEPYRIDDLQCSVSDFYQKNHQMILKAMLVLSERNVQIDIVSVAEYLDQRKELEDVGGVSYLGSLAVNSTGGANIHHYANTVRDKALRRELIATANTIIETALNSAESATEIVSEAESAIYAVSDKRETKEPVDISTAVMEAAEKIETIIDGVQWLPSGLADFDKLTGGLHGGAVYVIAARPSMGKTALACSIAHAIGKAGKSVYFATLEMPRREIASRMIAIDTNLNIGQVKEWQDVDYDKFHVGAQHVSDMKITIDHEEGLTIAKLRGRTRRIKRKKGLDCIVVDYLQLMRHKADNREREIAALSGGIKSLAKELDVPVILLAQLNRDCDSRADKRPLLSDLRESGSIEQDADVVTMLYRDDVYNKDSQYKGVAELLVRKNRHGATGDFFTVFSHQSMRFSDISEQWERPQEYTAPKLAKRGFN